LFKESGLSNLKYAIWLAMGLAIKELYGLRRETSKNYEAGFDTQIEMGFWMMDFPKYFLASTCSIEQ
jgi:hypothetical protein